MAEAWGAEGVAAGGEPDAVALEQRLRALEDAGARLFDAAACDHIRRLLAGAEARGEAAGRILRRRARERLGALAAAHARGGERARQALAALREALPGESCDALATALEAGDVLSVLRAERRFAGSAVAGIGGVRREASGGGEGQRAYRDAVADWATRLSGARASARRGEDAGLLNGGRLAGRVMAAAESLSPAYRRALVSRLVDLAPLLALPAARLPRKRV